MTRRLTQFLAIFLVLSVPVAAFGQLDDWYVAPSVVFIDGEPIRKTDDGLVGFQINVGRNMWDFAALELALGYSELDGFYPFGPGGAFVRDTETHLDFSANILYFFNPEATFSPYMMLGAGYLGVNLNGGGEENRPSFSGGLGFKYRVGQSNFDIRGEYRARLAYEEDYNFLDHIVTLGVQYNFGGSKGRSSSTPVNTNTNIDTDGDGVLDIWDECPDTPAGVAVTSRGCPLENLDRDADQDNIFDNFDECPNTPLGVPVNSVGCSLDSDRDGVTTDKDRCPGSAPGVEVNIYGCANDDDRDGVPNHRDNCPDTRSGVRIDIYGCEIKDVINLPGVNFETGFDILLPGTEFVLQNATKTLNKYPNLLIEVAGHTDDVGNDDSNESLSERRAKTVWAFLIRYGVDESRLSFKGYGESLPIADNSTEEGRATNRRVELRLVNP
ncbi:MAG: OOP family OmpA-OmpF porin [Gammaproteobacteria bacterium]|jgi:OOP family OmpA-OmpF porin